jgi:hypothetical protein
MGRIKILDFREGEAGFSFNWKPLLGSYVIVYINVISYFINACSKCHFRRYLSSL